MGQAQRNHVQHLKSQLAPQIRPAKLQNTVLDAAGTLVMQVFAFCVCALFISYTFFYHELLPHSKFRKVT